MVAVSRVVMSGVRRMGSKGAGGGSAASTKAVRFLATGPRHHSINTVNPTSHRYSIDIARSRHVTRDRQTARDRLDSDTSVSLSAQESSEQGAHVLGMLLQLGTVRLEQRRTRRALSHLA